MQVSEFWFLVSSCWFPVSTLTIHAWRCTIRGNG